MPRFLVLPEQARNGRFTLTGSEARHARTVLRKKPGDEIDLFDGENTSFTGRIEQIDDFSVAGTILQETRGTSVGFELRLCQALLKGPKWDWLLEKACEVGVCEIIPLLTKRTVIRPSDENAPGKLERWNRIALAASKQSGRSTTMKIASPAPIATVLKTLPSAGLYLIPWEMETERSIAQACAGRSAKEAHVFVGPEGGWAPEEIDEARKAGAVPVKLGPTLLRSETAGLVAAALTLREFGVY
jgi:16S rRNA (uracil1498-N3)-methyltransferase